MGGAPAGEISLAGVSVRGAGLAGSARARRARFFFSDVGAQGSSAPWDAPGQETPPSWLAFTGSAGASSILLPRWTGTSAGRPIGSGSLHGQRATIERHWSEIPGYSKNSATSSTSGSLRVLRGLSLVRSHISWATEGRPSSSGSSSVLAGRQPAQPGRELVVRPGDDLRQMAWCFGFFGFAQAPASTRAGWLKR